MNYEKDIKIDETALDVEWLHQPRLALKYGMHYAECYKKVQQIEESIKVCRAELTKEANEKLDKPTAPNVESYYRTHPRHIALKQEWIEATYELNIADAAKKEIGNSRKLALENLVRLNGQNYFASPTMPRDLSYEAAQKETQKHADSKVGSAMKRSK